MLDQKVRDVMTRNPVCLPPSATVTQAAEAMRAQNIGDVIITKGNELAGIVTDRDIVVRAIAMGLDPTRSTLSEVATPRAICLTPDQSAADAVRLMREQ